MANVNTDGSVAYWRYQARRAQCRYDRLEALLRRVLVQNAEPCELSKAGYCTEHEFWECPMPEIRAALNRGGVTHDPS